MGAAISDITYAPDALAKHYKHFKVEERILLTGHSHQAWPDCALEGLQEAWFDAAECVDDKWERAFQKQDRVIKGYASLLDDDSGQYTLAENTHDCIVRLLSALPLKTRPKIITTDGEFYTFNRQLRRLSEDGIESIFVPVKPYATLVERLIDRVRDDVAIVMVSAVMYESAYILPSLKPLLDQCVRVGAECLIDVYHALNVVPFSLRAQGLEEAFVVGGGYKYCQLGEGCGFLRAPAGRRFRPIITGWFADFDALTGQKQGGPVSYGGGGQQFAGATYDPTSHYRAAKVFDFFEGQKLTPGLLRNISQHQVGVLMKRFDQLDITPDVIHYDSHISSESRAGFLSLYTKQAQSVHTFLKSNQIHTDVRGSCLRLGPAPYLTDQQLDDAMNALGEFFRSVA